MLNLIINGVAQGCVYGLVALGFVLIYKATGVVNLARGEFLMLGAFAGYTIVGLWGLPYCLGLTLSAVCLMALATPWNASCFDPCWVNPTPPS